MNHSALYQKLIQHCKSTIKKIKKQYLDMNPDNLYPKMGLTPDTHTKKRPNNFNEPQTQDGLPVCASG